MITLGWSDELGEKIASDILAIGLHCVLNWTGTLMGTIQLQIIDSITMTAYEIFHSSILRIPNVRILI